MFKRDQRVPLQQPKGCIYPLKLPSGAPRTLVSERITQRYATPPITRELQEFRPANLEISKSELLLSYIRDRPASPPATPKLSASHLWLFLFEGEGAGAPIVYIPGRGRFVYNNCGVEQYEDLLQFTSLILTTFRPAIQTVRSIAVSRNLFKARTKGARTQWGKYLTGLECELSGSFEFQGLSKNARHFSAWDAPLEAGPFLLQLQNATVGLRGNVIRPISPSTT